MARRRVSSAARDGRHRGRTVVGDLRASVRQGQSAARRGLERWCNPLTGRSAHGWTYGWNREHTKDGPCKGCPQCLSGATQPVSYRDWIQQRRTED